MNTFFSFFLNSSIFQKKIKPNEWMNGRRSNELSIRVKRRTCSRRAHRSANLRRLKEHQFDFRRLERDVRKHRPLAGGGASASESHRRSSRDCEAVREGGPSRQKKKTLFQPLHKQIRRPAHSRGWLLSPLLRRRLCISGAA